MKLEKRERLDPSSSAEIELAQLVVSLRDDSFRSTQKQRTLMREELDYALRLKHYQNDTGQTRNQQLVQPHGPELFNHIRHLWSQICAVPTYIECRPQQAGQDDPQLAEDAKLVLESVLYDPLVGYAKKRRRWVMGGLAARQWIMAVDVEDDYAGPGVCLRLLPGWMFHVAPGWQDMHDLTCPWVGEEATMRLGDVLAAEGWKNKDQVVSDSQAANTSGASSGVPLGASNLFHKQSASGLDESPSSTEVVTIYKWWFRYDGETYEEEEVIPLSPQEQYAECPLCGYQTPDVARDLDGEIAPTTGVDMCPRCQAAPLLPVREAIKTDTYLKYPKGRLVIVAAKCNVVLYDGPWPHEMRSFPYQMAKSYDSPLDPSGLSETALHWTSQTILNNLRRFSWEQMRRNVDILIAPKDGLVNSKNQPFMPSDLPGQMAWWTKIEAVNGIKHFQGSGIPSGLPALYSIFSEQFQTGRGSTDLGMTAAQIKGTPVGTVETFVEQGELPVRDKLQAIQEEESIFFGVLLDIIVQIWPEDGRAVRYMGPDGAFRLKNLQRSVLTNQMDVVVSAAPTMSIIRADELKNILGWTSIFKTDPAAGILAAKIANIPPSMVREYLQNRDKMGTTNPEAPGPGGGGPETLPGPTGGLPSGAGGTIGVTP